MDGAIEFGSREWLPLAIAIFVIGAASLAWSLYRSPIRNGLVILATNSQAVALASVALYLV